MSILSTTQLKQYLLLAIILGLGLLLARNLFPFFPGLLGAVTCYILMRQWFFRLTIFYGWKKWAAALLFITLAILLLVVPTIFLGMILGPKALAFLNDASGTSAGITTMLSKARHIIPGYSIDESQIHGLMQRASAALPSFLGSAATVLTNVLLCFFLLYFMLVEGRRMERRIQNFLPLKDENIDQIWQATRVMVVSNAIGIPLLAMFQAITACIGYYFFGVDQWLLWGILTGLCSLMPVIGTAIVWLPLCLYQMSTGSSSAGVGLLLYSVIVTVNIDNVLRFTLLKKLGDVHPIITVLGIIFGIPIFGFMGFIFGPLLISYLLLLVRVYQVEFASRHLNRPDA